MFTTVSLLSLLMCVATVTLWVRSYCGGLGVTYLGSRIVWASCSEGMIAVDVRTCRDGWLYTGSWSLEGYGGVELETPHGWAYFEGNDSWIHYRVWAARFWLLLPLISSPLAANIAMRYRRYRLLRCGHCPTCGYDLRASTNRCPECGTPIRPAGLISD